MLHKALSIMQKAIKQVPDDPVMREHYGDIYYKLSNKSKARSQWLKSLALEQKNDALRKRFQDAGFGDPDKLLKEVKKKGKKRAK